jgi:hypothetical protein
LPPLTGATIPSSEWQFADLEFGRRFDHQSCASSSLGSFLGPIGRNRVSLGANATSACLKPIPSLRAPIEEIPAFALRNHTAPVQPGSGNGKPRPGGERIPSRQLSAPAYMQLATRAPLQYFACAMAQQPPPQITALPCQHHKAADMPSCATQSPISNRTAPC